MAPMSNVRRLWENTLTRLVSAEDMSMAWYMAVDSSAIRFYFCGHQPTLTAGTII
jgi:hypothetical protein